MNSGCRSSLSRNRLGCAAKHQSTTNSLPLISKRFSPAFKPVFIPRQWTTPLLPRIHELFHKGLLVSVLPEQIVTKRGSFITNKLVPLPDQEVLVVFSVCTKQVDNHLSPVKSSTDCKQIRNYCKAYTTFFKHMQVAGIQFHFKMLL